MCVTGPPQLQHYYTAITMYDDKVLPRNTVCKYSTIYPSYTVNTRAHIQHIAWYKLPEFNKESGR